jgi:hypothetical protein
LDELEVVARQAKVYSTLHNSDIAVSLRSYTGPPEIEVWKAVGWLSGAASRKS